VNLALDFVPADFAFDASGNLWLAGNNLFGDSIEMYSAAELVGTGEISPSTGVTVNSPAFGSSHDCLGGLDFDGAGDLWVSVGSNGCSSGAVPGQLVEFIPAQLSTGGNLTPSVMIRANKRETNLFFPGPIRFGPTL